MPTLGAPLDFAKLEARNMQAHQLGALPTAPVKGQVYFDTRDNTLYWYDGSAWVSARGGAAATPQATPTTQGTIQLAGDLTGTATSPQIAAGAVTDAEVAAANKDGAAGTVGMRSLGTGATQAAAGNDSRLSDSRPASGTAGGDLSGTYPNPQIAAGVITDADVAAANKDGAAGTPSLRSIGNGAGKAMSGQYSLGDISTNIVTATDVHLNSRKIINLLDPTSPQDAATKYYVDSIAQGLDVKGSVRAASIANVTTMSGPQTVDGVSLIAGQRVLLKNQGATADNGIWIVNAGAWTRATDLDTSGEAIGAFVFVEEGTVNADSGWVCTVDTGFAININAMPWTQFAGVGEYTAGAGLTSTGKQFDVGAGPGITVNADTVQVANNGITNAMIADGAIDLGSADVANVLLQAKGGLGASGVAAAGKNMGRSNWDIAGYYSSATHGAGTTISIPWATHFCRAGRGLLVQVQDEATGNVELPDVSINSAGDVTVTYAVAVAANSKRVTVIG